MLLQEPSVPGDHAGRRFELRGSGISAAYPLAKTSNSKKVVADRAAGLTEIVEDAGLDLLRRVRRKKRPHPHGEPVLAPKPECVLLIREIACIDDGSQSKAVRVSVHFGRSA